MPSPSPSPVQRFFGALLMVVGGLMAALCGSCGALFLVAGLATLSSSGDGQVFLMGGLIMGGIPALIGFGLFAWGRALRREPPRSSLPQANFDDPD